MKIGIMSDTHGDLTTTRQAVELLLSAGAEALVHCGDIGSELCLEELAQSGVPVYAVAGNVDDRLSLATRAQELGVKWGDLCVETPLGEGKLAAVTHGDVAAMLTELVDSGRYAYVLTGHTHRGRAEQRGRTTIINPGALHRAAVRSVCLLDTSSGKAELIVVGRP